eukprot:CAMPEP_0172805016 /NCGR_PEP_ID=MMETSP1075-20121228/5539_1 /TAXON_ID=2916 /ORGANISM="Ceratium fusus, Strain PA161109" /LENGTH=57 /DNA_ID=CAMNT_0013643681 /DNA_START=358 /DNA_END=531 /DNA_ORIENTATION=-
MPCTDTIGTCNGIYVEKFATPHLELAIDILMDVDPILLKAYVIPVSVSITECDLAEE